MMTSPEPGMAAMAAQEILLQGFSYEERRSLLSSVTDVISSGGCWLKERRITSFSQVEFFFEMHLRSALEIYSALIAAGLELSQASHAELTGLCTMRRHKSAFLALPSRVMCVRLEVSFLEEADFGIGSCTSGVA